MSNKTSDKNVGSIEDDVKRCNELIKVEHANWIGISNQLAISHILAEREQLLKERDVANDSVIAHKFAIMQQQINEKDKRIQELEEESRKKSIELICYQEELENSISTQVVIDKIKENSNIEKEIEEKIKEEENSGDICREYIRDLKRQKGLVKRDILTLQELLEGEK
mgnify:CR=1 FL=1